MGRKFKILIIIIIVLFLAVFAFNMFSSDLLSQNSENVENIKFELPENYYEGSINKNGDINITNGNDTIFLSEFDAKDLNKSITSYEDYCLKNNYTILKSNLTMGNVNIYKFEDANSGSSHYWFVKDDKGYSIYTWQKVDGIDNIVEDLLVSIN